MFHRIPMLFLLFGPLFLFSTISGYNTSEMKSLCSKTPYPQPCEYFLTHRDNDPSQSAIKGETNFLQVTVQLALQRAARAHSEALALLARCTNEREKAAWADCLELYDLTIFRLNKTANPVTKDDAQTWLSAALTNLDTCNVGFDDLGVNATILLPTISTNASQLISNALAVNDGPYNQLTSHDDRLPSWVKSGDRKLLQASVSVADVVVAQDGSGNYKTIKEALEAAEQLDETESGKKRHVIYMKKGVYNEHLEIWKTNVMMVGDGIGKTIITGSRSVGGGYTTFKSATVAIIGDRFIARDITFRNTAGAKNGQGVALRSGSDLSVFYQCSFEAYQDTLYVHSNRQFYQKCDIYGTVDFMFGNAAAVFQNCNIYPRYTPSKTNTITAQSRSDPNENTGIVIHNCRVRPADDLKPVVGSVRTFLGRPWRRYSRTVFMKTYMDGFINPAGWMPWDGNFGLDTLYYAEYMNTGAGSSTKNRVKWRGYHVMRNSGEASKFTVGKFISGDSWLPATKVPYTSGL